MTQKKKLYKAVFLDRDGTLCEESNYLSRADDLRVFEFSAAALRKLNEHGFLVIVITNQSGIARGFVSISELKKINKRLKNELESAGALIRAIYFCPHRTEDNCHCRKPNIGMLKEAEKEFDISLAESWLIGDKATDIETARNAGIKNVLVRTGYGKSEEQNSDADFVCDDLSSAVELIINRSRK